MKILKIFITLFNALTSIMHVLFQVYILNHVDIGAYTKFLLTENILIALVFFLVCIELIYSKFDRRTIRCNIFIWFFFAGCISILKPEHTTLDMFNLTLPFRQWIILLAISFTAITTDILYLLLHKTIEPKNILS